MKLPELPQEWRVWDPAEKATFLNWLRYSWKEVWARDDQLAPEGDWLIWLLLAGRGAGKTRSGAEYCREQAENTAKFRVGIIAPTWNDCRKICFEGESGLLECLPEGEIDNYNKSDLELVLKNKSRFIGYSAEKPDRLRGPQHHLLWCEEMAAWQYIQDTWDMAQFGLRLGDFPRTIITTTPRPLPLVKEIVARSEKEPERVRITRASTFDNAANLPASQLEEYRRKYANSYLGQQELYGAIIDDLEGALWNRAMLDENRVKPEDVPSMARIVVAIDPAVTSNEHSDHTGIVVLGRGADGHGYVLQDLSIKGSPDQWGRIAVNAFKLHHADRIVAEVNNGGDMIKFVLRTIDHTLPIKVVRASRGKHTRAEPIAALYEQGRVHHVGLLAKLEDEMCSWLPGDSDSPDRMDALVWAGTEVLLTPGVPSMSVAH